MQGLGRDTQNRDSPKREKDLRGSAILHQQRRLKQATQFVHKDSADLLPLDQLRRLGTSKDLPHSVIQRRLMGGSLSIESDNPVFPTSPCNRGRDAPPQGDETIQPTKLGEEPPGGWKEQALLIPCKVCGHDAKAKLCTEHQQNLISRSCTERLGMGLSEQNGQKTLPKELRVDIELGPERLTGEAVIVDDDLTEICLGLRTLVSLKCCIDLERGVLKTPHQEIPFLNPIDAKRNPEEPQAAMDQWPPEGTRGP
ncbi:hypothetical protein XENTR_v10007769 [Xenopus tropicalis]|nr:hypothetical protein XENTR_v10007769 [Xenopus tropicalis]